MEELSIDYFRNLWQKNVKDLESLCELWENMCKEDTIPDEVLGEIRTSVGLARLLMGQKLLQFKGLIDDAEFKTGEKEITCLDLQGFWDMVYSEVEKIQKSFESLLKCKNNNWKFIEEPLMKQIKKKVPVQNISNKKADNSKSHSLAARQRLAEIKKKMLAQQKQMKEGLVENIHSLQENVNYINGRNASDISCDIKQLKENNVEVRQSPRIQKKAATADTEVTESGKENSNLKAAIKNKEIHQQNQVTSQQNKENVSLLDKTSRKTKESTEISQKKSRGKSKDFGKLQCVTRSAKKALMTQQNST